MIRNKKFWYIFIVIIILALSIATHFAFFGHPNETVFDEVHFGKFVSGYLNHKYFFDIHPPLGKLMISGVAKLGGFKPGFGFQNIGDTFPDNSYLWLRLLPVIAGTLLPLVIFFLARELRLSIIAAFSASLLVIFENALLGQSLFILLDSLLLLFGFFGLLLYLIARRRESIWIYALAFIFLTFSVSIKWTGFAFLALVVIIEICDFIKNKIEKNPILNFWPRIIIMILLPFAIYFSIFALHFTILNKSGDGDAFHSQEFQKTLSGNIYQGETNIKSANIFEKFLELNIEMFRANGRITDKHPYASKWYTWPMMAKPIYYWNEDSQTNQAKIYLFGNPIIFWGGFLGLVVLILDTIFFPQMMYKKIKTTIFIIIGFLLNFLPFIFIKRPMFLYHYLAALIFTILALCFVIDLTKNKRKKIIIFIIILALAISSFFFFSPLTYGLKLSTNSFNARLWTKNWQ